MLKNKLSSPDYFSNQNTNCFKSIINNMEFRNRRQSVGENEACLVCLPVHRKDNMVSFESSLSQWQALLHCWSALDFLFFFFPTCFTQGSETLQIFCPSLSSGLQICFRELWEWQAFPASCAGRIQRVNDTSWGPHSYSIWHIHQSECQRHKANTGRSLAIVPKKL